MSQSQRFPNVEKIWLQLKRYFKDEVVPKIEFLLILNKNDYKYKRAIYAMITFYGVNGDFTS